MTRLTNKSKITLILLSMVLITAVLLAVFFAPTLKADALTNTNGYKVIGEIYDSTTKTFDKEKVQELLNALSGGTDGTLKSLSDATIGKSGISAGKLTAGTKGTQTGGTTFPNTLSAKEIATNSGAKGVVVTLGGIQFMAVAVTKQDTGEIVLTLYAMDKIDDGRTQYHNTTTTVNGFVANIYDKADIRTKVLTNTSGVLGTLNTMDGKYFVTPNQIAWQTDDTEQTGINEDADGTNSEWGADRIWLPSFTETGSFCDGDFEVEGDGLWHLTNEQAQQISGSGDRAICLLRTAVSGTSGSYYVYSLSPDKGVNVTYTTYGHALRPAIHLNLNAITDCYTEISGLYNAKTGKFNQIKFQQLIKALSGTTNSTVSALKSSVTGSGVSGTSGTSFSNTLSAKEIATNAVSKGIIVELGGIKFYAVAVTRASSGDMILTLYAVNNVTTSKWATNSSNVYNSSIVRTELNSTTGTFAAILAMDAKYFATPSLIAWQTNATEQAGINERATGIWATDRIWLPSWTETGSYYNSGALQDEGDGLWHLTKEQRLSGWTWLRTGEKTHVRYLDSGVGAACIVDGTYTRGVCPALHINLTKVEPDATEVTVEHKVPTAVTGDIFYDGKAKTLVKDKPASAVASETIKYGTTDGEFTETVAECKAAGYYQFTYKLNGNGVDVWTDNVTDDVVFVVQIKQATNSWTTTPTVSSPVYGTAVATTGAAKFGTPSVKYTGRDGTTYDSATAPTDAGSYTATFTVTETNDYTGLSQTVDFAISRQGVARPAANSTALTYNGSAQTIITGYDSVKMTASDVTDGATLSGTTYTATAANSYSVTFTPTANYQWSDGTDTTGPHTVTKEIAKLVVAVGWTAPTNLVYDGSAKVPAAVVSNKVGSEDVNVTVALTTGNDNVNVGKFTYTASGITGDDIANYEFTSSVTSDEYEITPATFTNVTVTPYNAPYDASAHDAATAFAATAVNDQTITWKWRLGETGEFSETMPTLTNVADSAKLYYQVSAPNHTTVEGSVDVAVTKADVTLSDVALNKTVYVGQTLAADMLTATAKNSSKNTVDVAGALSFTSATTVTGTSMTGVAVHFVPTDTANYNTPSDVTFDLTATQLTVNLGTLANCTLNNVTGNGVTLVSGTTYNINYGGTVTFDVTTADSHYISAVSDGITLTNVSGQVASYSYAMGTATSNATLAITTAQRTVNYTVNHSQQNLACNGYDVVAADSETGSVNYNGNVSLTNKNYHGFTAVFTDASVTLTGGNANGTGYTVTYTKGKATEANDTAVISLTYNRNTYTVTFNTNGGTSIDSQNVIYQATAESKTTTRDGYAFLYWYSNNEAVAYDFISEVTDNMTLNAKWAVNTYTVTFKDGSDTVATQTVEHGNTAENMNYAKDGYVLAGWFTEGGDLYDFTETVTADITLVAHFTEIAPTEYTVTFDTDGGSYVAAQTVAKNNSAEKPADPTREGYKFIGWNLDNASYNFASAVTGNITLVAKWQVVTYKVSFDVNGGTDVPTQTVAYNETATVPSTPTRNGYTFDGWFVSADDNAAEYDFTSAITADVTVYAKWTVLPDPVEPDDPADDPVPYFAVTFDSNGGSVLAGVAVLKGEKVTRPTAPQKDGYVFDGWTLNGTAYDFDTAVTADITLTAKWIAVEYTVTFDAANGSATTSVKVTAGSRVDAPAVPQKAADASAPDGYAFDGWYNGETRYTFEETVNANITLTAKWTVVPAPVVPTPGDDPIPNYVVTFDSCGGSFVASQVIASGSDATVPTQPTREGYTFLGWFDAAEGGNAFVFTNVTANKTAYAHWEIVSYTVTVDGTANSVEYNSKFTRPSDPAAQVGKTFIGWYTSDGVLYDFDAPVTADITLVSKFSVNKYVVTIVVDDVKTEQILNYGDTVSVPETPVKDGFVFKGWLSDGNAYDFATPVAANLEIVATWEAVPTKDPVTDDPATFYTVTFQTDGGSAVAGKAVKDGEVIGSVSDPTKNGYTFVGWYTEDGRFVDLTKEVVSANITLVAKWDAVSVTVDFVVDGKVTTVTTTYGSTVSDRTASKTGYTFTGWYLDDVLYNFDTVVTEHIELVARFEINKFVVVINNDGVATNQTVSYGDLVDLSAISTDKVGYTFTGWTVAGSSYDVTTPVTENITLVANYSRIMLTVEFDVDGVATQNIAYGDKAQTPATPVKASSDGVEYIFAGWLLNGAPYNFDVAVTENISLTANWTEVRRDPTNPTEFFVVFEVDGGSFVASQKVAKGSQAQKPVDPTKDGYTFEGWCTDEALNNAYDFSSAVTADIKLYAKWSVTTLSVTLNKNNGESAETLTVNYGDVATISEPTRVGYKFTGWTLNGAAYDVTSKVTSDITLDAQWQAITYKVTFDANGGSGVEDQTISYNGKAVEPTTLREGYTLKYWYYVAEGTVVEYDFDTVVTSNLTLTAKWDINYYTVTFDSDGGSAVENQTVGYGSFATLVTPTKDNYVFDGWYLYDGATLYTFADAVTGDLALKAKWTAAPAPQEPDTPDAEYVVSFDTNGGSYVANAIVVCGNKVTKPADPTREGYTFTGWTLDNVAYDFDTATVTQNITLTATWEKETYTVTFDSNGGIGVVSQTVAYNETATVPSTPTREGYTFLGWFVSADENAEQYDFATAITANTTIVAKWTKVPDPVQPDDPTDDPVPYYSVTFDTNGGSVLAGVAVLKGGKVTRPTAPLKDGYVFDGWTLNGTAYDFDTAVTADITLTAKWKALSYTVTFDSDGGSAVDPQTVAYGSYATIPTPTKANSVFDGWYLGETLYTFSDPVTENITLVAHWKTVSDPTTEFVVTFDSCGGSFVSSQIVASGSNATTPTAPTREGYTFAGWFDAKTGGNAFVFTNVTADKTAYAQWDIVYFTVAVDGKSYSVQYNSKFTKPTAPAAPVGKIFAGWYTESGILYDFDTPVTSDIVLVAKFVEAIISEITISWKTTQPKIFVGASVDTLKPYLKVVVKYNNGGEVTLSEEDYTLSVAGGALVEGNNSLTATRNSISSNALNVVASVAELTGITATINLGSVVVYTSTDIASLKQYITAIALYNNDTQKALNVNDFTLSVAGGTLSAGNVELIVTYLTKTAKVNVNVVAVAPTSIEISYNQGSNKLYISNTLEDLKQFLTVTAHYNDGTNATVTNYTLSVADADGKLVAGNNIITVTYGSVQSKTFTAVVSEMAVNKIDAATTVNTPDHVYANTSLDELKNTLDVYVSYTDGNRVKLKANQFTLTGTLEEGKTSTLTVTYTVGGQSYTSTVQVNVSRKEISGLDAVFTQGGNKVYAQSALSTLKDMLVVTISYNDGTTKVLKADEYELSIKGASELVKGENTIEVTLPDSSFKDEFTVSVLSVIRLDLAWDSLKFTYDEQIHLPKAVVKTDDGATAELELTSASDGQYNIVIGGREIVLSVAVSGGNLTDMGNYTISVTAVTEGYKVNNEKVTLSIVSPGLSSAAIGIICAVAAVAVIATTVLVVAVKKMNKKDNGSDEDDDD